MPTKDKSVKTKIKVEEVSEEKDKLSETPEETPVVPESTPKVTSFSQLDTPKVDVKSPKEEHISEETTGIASKPQTPMDESQEPVKEEPADAKKEKEQQLSSEEVKSWLKEVRPDTTKEVEKTSGPNIKVILVIVLSLLILGALVGGVFYYRSGVSKPREDEDKTTTLQVTNTPTPTPIEEVDLKAYSISVLNGSGVVGEAGKVSDLLKGKGFDEGKIEKGNADSYDYKSTSVSLKKDTPTGVYDAIKDVLQETYDVTKSETVLDDDSSYDVIIIVGERKET